jgi:hypothetical protein
MDAAVGPEMVNVATSGKSGAEEGIWPRWETGLVRGSS